MKFLIIGGLGYIGQVLQEELKKSGHEFKIVDNDLFDLHSLENKLDIINEEDFPAIESLIKESDIVVTLAAIVGDQACLVDAKRSIEINCGGIQNLVKFCNAHNKKIIHASTCSLYGASPGLLVETSDTFPVDFYGQTKYQQERHILSNSKDYCVFRLGTAYGWSKRMRFDLVINLFTARAYNSKVLNVFGGEQWRPFVHIRDVAKAIIFASEKDLNGVFNLANENRTILDISKEISGGKVEVHADKVIMDSRNYRADSTKLLNRGFVFEWNISKGIREMGDHPEDLKNYQDSKYSNSSSLKNVVKKTSKKRILVLGGKGMAGHIITDVFREDSSFDVVSLGREDMQVEGDWRAIISEIDAIKKVDFLINCIGVLKPVANANPILAMKVNSLFPHELASFCKSKRIKIIHLSTDCFNDLDVYGRSKRAGELDYPEHLTVRTSIIGPELKQGGSGLFHWFMSQKGSVSGYSKHYWDGVTTLELSNRIKEIIKANPSMSGIVNLRSKGKLSKYELLKTLSEQFDTKIKVNPTETEVVDKTMVDAEILTRLSLKEQIVEMREWMSSHKEKYASYLGEKIKREIHR